MQLLTLGELPCPLEDDPLFYNLCLLSFYISSKKAPLKHYEKCSLFHLKYLIFYSLSEVLWLQEKVKNKIIKKKLLDIFGNLKTGWQLVPGQFYLSQKFRYKMKLIFRRIFDNPLQISHFENNFLNASDIFLAIYQNQNTHTGLALQLRIQRFPVRRLLTCLIGLWDPT